jgi:hypothetical protein
MCDFVFHDLDRVAQTDCDAHFTGAESSTEAFPRIAANLLCARKVHAHFNKFDRFSAASIVPGHEVQNGAAPVMSPVSLPDRFEFTYVVGALNPMAAARLPLAWGCWSHHSPAESRAPCLEPATP